MSGDEDATAVRKTFWRSASWSSSRPAPGAAENTAANNGRRFPPLPLTPRSKSRSCLPPLQPLSIARRSVDEWPSAGSDDVGEWAQQPPTPGAPRPDLDLSCLRTQAKKDQIAFFDKECSKVADHIYLGGDAVARNREILRQHGITHVLNCVGFVCPEYFKSDLSYKTLWLQDRPNEDITSILYNVFDYFEDVREQKGRVFVHCCQGVSRSTSLVIAYLMWREGQSFDDAFQFVKAARGIADPNMGFACQLLQCQKRVHAVPLSPNSVLRMYRMAPHSPYDPLHLVPKMLNDPSPASLDSRGAFILHVLASIYVWIGKNCEAVMEKDAKAAAFQVVRYERVPGSIVTIEEGHEPSEFWDAFSNASLTSGSETTLGVSKEDIELSIKIGFGKRKVKDYDVDFELFYRAIAGGVVPPFPSSGLGHETHLPARENNWSLLRRKFFCRVYSDSLLARDVDPRGNHVQLLTAEALASPPYPSPSSLLSDSSSNSKCSLDSPSLSPSTFSPSSLYPSPASSNLPDSWEPSSTSSPGLSSSLEQLKPCPGSISSPSNGISCSIADRRGRFSPLKLPTLAKDTLFLPGKLINGSFVQLTSPQDIVKRSNINQITNIDALDSRSSVGQIAGFRCVGATTDDSSENKSGPLRSPVDKEQSLASLNGSTDSSSESLGLIEPLVYRYPEMKRLAVLGREDLDSKAVFLLLIPNKGKGEEPGRILYLWIGNSFKQDNGQIQHRNDRDVDEFYELDWHRIGCDFLASMGLPKDLPIKVVKEQDAEEFLSLLNWAYCCSNE